MYYIQFDLYLRKLPPFTIAANTMFLISELKHTPKTVHLGIVNIFTREYKICGSSIDTLRRAPERSICHS